MFLPEASFPFKLPGEKVKICLLFCRSWDFYLCIFYWWNAEKGHKAGSDYDLMDLKCG